MLDARIRFLVHAERESRCLSPDSSEYDQNKGSDSLLASKI